jgi:hypothetical protein
VNEESGELRSSGEHPHDKQFVVVMLGFGGIQYQDDD